MIIVARLLPGTPVAAIWRMPADEVIDYMAAAGELEAAARTATEQADAPGTWRGPIAQWPGLKRRTQSGRVAE